MERAGGLKAIGSGAFVSAQAGNQGSKRVPSTRQYNGGNLPPLYFSSCQGLLPEWAETIFRFGGATRNKARPDSQEKVSSKLRTTLL